MKATLPRNSIRGLNGEENYSAYFSPVPNKAADKNR